MFAMNIDELVKESDVYAIDLPGFARSSRPNFRYSLANQGFGFIGQILLFGYGIWIHLKMQ